MKILAHRGLWRKPEEQNTLGAFRAAFDAGFGAELDIRDSMGWVVVSHDPVTLNYPPLRLETVLTFYSVLCSNLPLPLALNIKADGLLPLLPPLPPSAFCFDMSTPEMLRYAEAGVRFFTRYSEHDYRLLQEQAAGVWWDWRDVLPEDIDFEDDKLCCLVSPELHGKPHLPFWDRLKTFLPNDRVMLCTDHPEEARAFFFDPKAELRAQFDAVRKGKA